MTDIKCNKEMTAFHNEKVTLSRGQQDDMRNRRDAGRKRLKTGLEQLKKPSFKYCHSQGSYSMRTMVQVDDKNYDIDDGAYFSAIDLEDDSGKKLAPKAVRELVCNALKQDERLKKDPIVKRNCVRQEYPEGYHIDIPVYHIEVTGKDANGNSIENYYLASGDDWIESDARAVTSWFNDKVGTLNALSRGDSDGSQLRRVVKLTKKFARRANWKDSTTSGICITKLVVDNFKPNENRDDESLRETWESIYNQLRISTEIKHPVSHIDLASVGDQEVEFFRDCLEESLSALKKLDEPSCTQTEARKTWDKIFDTDFFTNQPGNNSDDNGGSGEKAMVPITGETARRKGNGRFG